MQSQCLDVVCTCMYVRLGHAILSADVKSWSIVQVCEWLEEISLGQYSDQFKAHEIRGQELVALQKSDLMVCRESYGDAELLWVLLVVRRRTV